MVFIDFIESQTPFQKLINTNSAPLKNIYRRWSNSLSIHIKKSNIMDENHLKSNLIDQRKIVRDRCEHVYHRSSCVTGSLVRERKATTGNRGCRASGTPVIGVVAAWFQLCSSDLTLDGSRGNWFRPRNFLAFSPPPPRLTGFPLY